MLLVAALLTMLVGTLGAIAQSDIKRLLSFTLVSHIGYMVFGIALSNQLGMSGAIYYVAHHILVQTTLFLAAARPPSRRSVDAPAWRSIRPTTRNSVGLHQDVVRDVVDRARQPELAGQRDAEHHVADVADQGEGQQPLDVALRDGAQDADEHREQRRHHQHVVEPAVGEQQRVRRG